VLSALDMIPAMRSVEFDVEAATRSLEDLTRSDGPEELDIDVRFEASDAILVR
jgi:hypothetical protein